MKIGGHGSLIACVAPGISIQSFTQSLFLTPTCRDTQLLYESNKIYSRTGIHVLLRTVECNDVKKISPELIAIMFEQICI